MGKQTKALTLPGRQESKPLRDFALKSRDVLRAGPAGEEAPGAAGRGVGDA